MKTLLIECGVAETRAALLQDGVLWKVWFGAARGDEALDRDPRAGRRFAGRIRRVDQGLAAAFVDLGDGREGYLPVRKSFAAACVEGAMMEVEIKAPPRQDKGALLRYVGPCDEDAPRRLPPLPDAVLEAAAMIGVGCDEIIVDDGAAKQTLERASDAHVRHEIHALSLFAAYGVESDLAAAFERIVDLPGGGRLVFDEAQALTAVDVDTGGLSAASPARLRERIACQAADEAVRQLSLRSIGGHVAIDFPDIASEAGRKRFNDRLRQAMSRLEKAGAASFSKSGLFSFTLPHRERSLLEQFTEPAPAAVMPGRRFTAAAMAKQAAAFAEHALRVHPSARYRLALRPAVHAVVEAHPQWGQRLSDRYGARCAIVQDAETEERGFELSEQ